MGYDPIVHCVDASELRYVYEIPTEAGTRYFNTVDYTGGNTRVWSTIEVERRKSPLRNCIDLNN
jgi:hypothetical protein